MKPNQSTAQEPSQIGQPYAMQLVALLTTPVTTTSKCGQRTTGAIASTKMDTSMRNPVSRSLPAQSTALETGPIGQTVTLLVAEATKLAGSMSQHKQPMVEIHAL